METFFVVSKWIGVGIASLFIAWCLFIGTISAYVLLLLPRTFAQKIEEASSSKGKTE